MSIVLAKLMTMIPILKYRYVIIRSSCFTPLSYCLFRLLLVTALEHRPPLYHALKAFTIHPTQVFSQAVLWKGSLSQKTLMDLQLRVRPRLLGSPKVNDASCGPL